MVFRFRAAAALDVRRKEEEAARIAVAKAENAVLAATERSRQAQAMVAEHGRRLTDAQQQGTEAFRIRWHQAWIERQRRDAEARARELAELTAEAATAAQAAREAVKRRRVLERLRDRAWHTHQRVVHEQHVREMNELATLRFVAQIGEEGGTQ